MIQAIIFDMDGLLIDSEPLWRRAIRAAYKTVGLELTDEQMYLNRGMRTNEVVAYWYSKYPWEGPSQKDIEALIVDRLIDLVKKEGQLKPGVHHALEICGQAKLPLAIASSSSNEIINTVVDTLKIRDFFKHIYSAEHEPLGKPHPGVFITTAGLLGVSTHDIVVFEDAPSGVLAAKAAKMYCIAVPEADTKNHPFIQTADIVIDSLEQFDRAMLDRFFND
jgi:HAD superfamily hydrolase (TIGR01509 family)